MPHYSGSRRLRVFGKKTVEDILAVSEKKMLLKGISDRITCPILVVHGENDRQISLSQAEQIVAECTASPKAEFYVRSSAHRRRRRALQP